MKKISLVLAAFLLISFGSFWVGSERVKNVDAPAVVAQPKNEVFSYTRPKSNGYNVPITLSATCYFQRFSSVKYKDPENSFAASDTKKIIYESSEDSKPNIVAFVDLDKESPKLTANGGQGELLKVIDNDEMVAMVEKSPLQIGANTIVYTIYKKEAVATWTKQYSLLTIPYAHVAMGYCE